MRAGDRGQFYTFSRRDSWQVLVAGDLTQPDDGKPKRHKAPVAYRRAMAWLDADVRCNTLTAPAREDGKSPSMA